nr:hypothetical protein [uncultured bacterium]
MTRAFVVLLPLVGGLPPDAFAQDARRKTFDELVNTAVVMKLPRMEKVRVIG